MKDIQGEIYKIEKEIRETPYHKGTEHHVGKLRARLAKLRDRDLGGSNKSGGGSRGFTVKKQGDATLVLVGPPSSGKSTLINLLTNAESKVAPYAFTTLSVIPGMLRYRDAYIQILDVPGLIEGAKEGKGRGKEVLSVARGADLLLIMTDVERGNLLNLLTNELESAGIRINKTPPKLMLKKEVSGVLTIHSNIKQEIGEQTIREIANEFGVKNGEITLNETLSMDALIDAFSPSRVYLPAIYVTNKIDLSPRYHDSELKAVIHHSNDHSNEEIYISAEKGMGIEELKEEVWYRLRLLRVFLVRTKEEPSFKHAMIIKEGQSLKDLAEKIGTDFSLDKKSAKIWGSWAKFPGQEVSLQTPVQEGMQVRFIS